ncbi:MAG: RND family efflux transporter MFP subunit [Limisphaerales bacterium]|jgi:RND family efflux transporter MFP subunit
MRPSIRIILTFVGTVFLSACEPPAPPPVTDQWVRPARIFTVADSGTVQSLSFVGRVQALQTIDVSFEVPGVLNRLPIREGQEIPQGGLIAAVDSTDYELAVDEAEVQVKLAKQDLERKRSVLKQRGIARSVVDDAQAMYELQIVRLSKATERLAKTQLFAPFSATVARRYVDNFVNVMPNRNVARLHNMSALLVVANVPGSLLATASEEQLLGLHAEFDFAPGVQFELALHENRGEADSVAQTYEVSLMMARPADWNILPGMTATVFVSLKGRDAASAIHVPASALVSNPDKSFHVWVFDAESLGVQRRDVSVGAPSEAGIEITHGLSGGDQVVATGADFLQAGMKVRPLVDE